MRYVIDMIRAKTVSQAQAILNGSPRRARGIIRKLLNQAVDAAAKNTQTDAKTLFVSKVLADGGPSMRRFRAASMGRASVIRKRTSHIYLELDTLKKFKLAAPKAMAGGAVSKPKQAKTFDAHAPKTAPRKSQQKKMAGAK